MKIMVMIGSNVLGEIIIMKNAEHEGGKLVRVVMLKEEAGLAILNEIRHLITVSTNTRKSKGEGLDEDKAVSLEITRHTKDITHIVIFGFFVE